MPARWLTSEEVDAVNPTLAPGATLGASYCDEDGYITPPRNVSAYTAALVASGVVIAERTRFTGLSPDGRTVRTARGDIAAGRVILAGGPQLAALGALSGIAIPAGGVRHHVAVTEEHPAFADTPMVFDVPSGLYWRPEEGGLLFGMIGDRLGRKAALSAIILMISVATALMGLVPPYASIGLIAPILIFLLRLVQGLSAGGEWMGAVTYIIESSPAGKRAWYGSFQTITIVLGMSVAALASLLITSSMSESDLQAWGWRIPFLIALPLGLIGLYMRLKLADPAEFTEEMAPTELPTSGYARDLS